MTGSAGETERVLQTVRDISLILLLGVLCYVYGASSLPVHRIQEARVLDTARSMAHSGDYIIPKFNGKVRLEKPPLMYWLSTAAFKITGSEKAPAARMVTLLAVILTACGVYYMAASLYGRGVALTSACVLLSSSEFIRQGMHAEIDVLLICLITAALCFFMLWEKRGWKRDLLLFYLFCGLAFTAKGPAGFIPCGVVIVYLAINARDRLISFFSLSGLAVCAVVAFSWYAVVYLRMSAEAASVFSKELIVTFVSGSDHGKPFYYYIAVFFQIFLPWSLLFPFVVYELWKQKKDMKGLAFVWFSFVFLFLSFAVTNKQRHYGVLFLPPVSILTAKLLCSLDTAGPKLREGVLILCRVVCGIMTAGAVMLLVLPLSAPDTLYYLSVAAMGAVSCAAFLCVRKKSAAALGLFFAAVCLGVSVYARSIDPVIEECESLHIASYLKRAGADDVIFYNYFDGTLVYYYDKIIPVIYHMEKYPLTKGVYVISDKPFQKDDFSRDPVTTAAFARSDRLVYVYGF